MGIFSGSPKRKPGTQALKPSEAVAALYEPKGAIAEAYRTVRANLQFANLDKSKKTYMVTSAGPGEGKSTTVANLAVTMAMAGARTLVVDTDLRRPTIHKLFGLSNVQGVTSVLAKQVALEGAIQKGRLPNLEMISSGPLPPNPAELLMSHQMADLVEALKIRYDIVVFDSPPVISVSDTLVLASLLDAVILVIRSGGYPNDLIRQAKSQLDGVKAHIVGTLLNSVNFKEDGYYYQYYYYYYYGHYYGSEKK